MTDPKLETPEQFAVNNCQNSRCGGGAPATMCCDVLADAVHARDRRVALKVIEEIEAERKASEKALVRWPGQVGIPLRIVTESQIAAVRRKWGKVSR